MAGFDLGKFATAAADALRMEDAFRHAASGSQEAADKTSQLLKELSAMSTIVMGGIRAYSEYSQTLYSFKQNLNLSTGAVRDMEVQMRQLSNTTLFSREQIASFTSEFSKNMSTWTLGAKSLQTIMRGVSNEFGADAAQVLKQLTPLMQQNKNIGLLLSGRDRQSGQTLGQVMMGAESYDQAMQIARAYSATHTGANRAARDYYGRVGVTNEKIERTLRNFNLGIGEQTAGGYATLGGMAADVGQSANEGIARGGLLASLAAAFGVTKLLRRGSGGIPGTFGAGGDVTSGNGGTSTGTMNVTANTVNIQGGGGGGAGGVAGEVGKLAAGQIVGKAALALAPKILPILGTAAIATAGIAASIGAGLYFGHRYQGTHGTRRATGVGLGVASGAAAGALAGSFIPVIGTGVGAVIGGAIGGGTAYFSSREKTPQQKAQDELIAEAKKQAEIYRKLDALRADLNRTAIPAAIRGMEYSQYGDLYRSTGLGNTMSRQAAGLAAKDFEKVANARWAEYNAMDQFNKVSERGQKVLKEATEATKGAMSSYAEAAEVTVSTFAKIKSEVATARLSIAEGFGVSALQRQPLLRSSLTTDIQNLGNTLSKFNAFARVYGQHPELVEKEFQKLLPVIQQVQQGFSKQWGMVGEMPVEMGLPRQRASMQFGIAKGLGLAPETQRTYELSQIAQDYQLLQYQLGQYHTSYNTSRAFNRGIGAMRLDAAGFSGGGMQDIRLNTGVGQGPNVAKEFSTNLRIGGEMILKASQTIQETTQRLAEGIKSLYTAIKTGGQLAYENTLQTAQQIAQILPTAPQVQMAIYKAQFQNTQQQIAMLSKMYTETIRNPLLGPNSDTARQIQAARNEQLVRNTTLIAQMMGGMQGMMETALSEINTAPEDILEGMPRGMDIAASGSVPWFAKNPFQQGWMGSPLTRRPFRRATNMLTRFDNPLDVSGLPTWMQDITGPMTNGGNPFAPFGIEAARQGQNLAGRFAAAGRDELNNLNGNNQQGGINANELKQVLTETFKSGEAIAVRIANLGGNASNMGH